MTQGIKQDWAIDLENTVEKYTQTGIMASISTVIGVVDCQAVINRTEPFTDRSKGKAQRVNSKLNDIIDRFYKIDDTEFILQPFQIRKESAEYFNANLVTLVQTALSILEGLFNEESVAFPNPRAADSDALKATKPTMAQFNIKLKRYSELLTIMRENNLQSKFASKLGPHLNKDQ